MVSLNSFLVRDFPQNLVNSIVLEELIEYLTESSCCFLISSLSNKINNLVLLTPVLTILTLVLGLKRA